MCPHCKVKKSRIKKIGFFYRATSRRKKVQRYFCHGCRRSFSRRRIAFRYRERKSEVNLLLAELTAAAVSQRRCAKILKIHRTTVVRKQIKLGIFCKELNKKERIDVKESSTVVFDEMETFEHSKCKPLSIPIAVQEKTRQIIAIDVAQMPCKGRLAKISLKRYGYRKDLRRVGLEKVLKQVKEKMTEVSVLKSDECPRYPSLVRRHFPQATHLRFKGRRACVVGQGELKAGGFDPLFSLNHSCAMFRDNLKRLTRRTWCTTKKAERLGLNLEIYMSYHNAKIAGRKAWIKV